MFLGRAALIAFLDIVHSYFEKVVLINYKRISEIYRNVQLIIMV